MNAPEYPETKYWVYAPGGLASLAGLLLFSFAGEDAALIRLGSILFWGGLGLVAACNFIFGSPAAWRSFYRAVIALGGFLLIIFGLMIGVAAFAGVFDAPQVPYRAAGAAAALLSGMAAAYYGLKYQQSQEGLAIGKALGFAEADGQPGGDGVYDAKGVVNGVETLIDVEQSLPGRGPGASSYFSFKVLCRRPNAAGLRLYVFPGTAAQDAPPSGLTLVADVQYWKGCTVFSDKPDAAARALSAARPGGDAFTEEYGFKGMKLEGGRFEFEFRKDGHLSVPYAREVVRSAAGLAARF